MLAIDVWAQPAMFGTTFPQLPFDKCVAQVMELDLPEDIRAGFMCGNAVRVFGL